MNHDILIGEISGFLKNTMCLVRYPLSSFSSEPCPIGYFSATGYIPCTLCPRGYYQESDRSKDCVQCPAGQTTSDTGSTDIANCTSDKGISAQSIFFIHVFIIENNSRFSLCGTVHLGSISILLLI